MADVRQQVMLFLESDFEDYSTFQPKDVHAEALSVLLDQVVAWTRALASLRS